MFHEWLEQVGVSEVAANGCPFDAMYLPVSPGFLNRPVLIVSMMPDSRLPVHR
jgi:hypothetical protein